MNRQAALALDPASEGRHWLAVAVRFALVVCVHLAAILALAGLHPQLRKPTEPVFVSLVAEPRPLLDQSSAPSPPERKTPNKPVLKRDLVPAPATPREPLTNDARANGAETRGTEPVPGSASAERAEPAQPAAAVAPPAAPAAKPQLQVIAPRFDAAYLNNPHPEYPRMARRMGEHGRVVLHVYVSASGSAEKVEIRSSSGYPRLDQAARDAVQHWKFVPARQGEEPIGAWVLVPISFVLEG